MENELYFSGWGQKNIYNIQNKTDSVREFVHGKVIEQKHETPFRASEDKGVDGGMKGGRCSFQHAKKKNKDREAECQKARWCPWLTDMELIADCRLWFGLAGLAMPSAISLHSNLMDAAKSKTKIYAFTNSYRAAHIHTQIKLKRHELADTNLCV